MRLGVRPEDDDADHRSGDRGDENRPGRHILAAANQRMKFRRGGVGEKLEGCVQRLGRPDDTPSPGPANTA